jgi:hypothetical protein
MWPYKMLVESRSVGKSWRGISWIKEGKGVWWMEWGKLLLLGTEVKVCPVGAVIVVGRSS